MMIYTIIYYSSIIALPALVIALEISRRHKKKKWTTVSAKIIRSYIQTIVDVDSVFIDVDYSVYGTKFTKNEINTRSMNLGRFQAGDHLEMLVHPDAPQKIAIKAPTDDLFGVPFSYITKLIRRVRLKKSD